MILTDSDETQDRYNDEGCSEAQGYMAEGSIRQCASSSRAYNLLGSELPHLEIVGIGDRM